MRWQQKFQVESGEWAEGTEIDGHDEFSFEKPIILTFLLT